MGSYRQFGRLLNILGPGIVTGAADDDCSGIATYSQAGAGYGYGFLWSFPVMLPLMTAVQESCARIGAVTGKGLAAVIKSNYSKKITIYVCAIGVCCEYCEHWCGPRGDGGHDSTIRTNPLCTTGSVLLSCNRIDDGFRQL